MPTTRGVLDSKRLTRGLVLHPAVRHSWTRRNQDLYEEDDRLPQTLSYFILNRLRWRIITGELKPGQALRELEIEADYGSSRGPVRESLRMLLQSAWWKRNPGAGFVFARTPPQTCETSMNCGATLEGMVVAALEGRDLIPLCESLRGRLKIMESYYKQKDTDKYFRENSRFHQCIIDFTENKPISQVLFYVNGDLCPFATGCCSKASSLPGVHSTIMRKSPPVSRPETSRAPRRRPRRISWRTRAGHCPLRIPAGDVGRVTNSMVDGGEKLTNSPRAAFTSNAGVPEPAGRHSAP